MGPLSRLKTEPKMGHPHFQNVGLKLNAALDCEAAHSVVTGIRHWHQVIRQAVKFFHLLCCFEQLSVSPFGRTKLTPTAIVDDLRSQGITSVRAMASQLKRRVVAHGIQRQPLGSCRVSKRQAEPDRDMGRRYDKSASYTGPFGQKLPHPPISQKRRLKAPRGPRPKQFRIDNTISQTLSLSL